MYSAIAANKRNTVLIMAVFIGVVSAIGWAISTVYGYGTSTLPWIIGGALVYAVLQYFMASRLAMSMSGAREIQKQDNPRLWRIVENLAITEGMPMPRVFIIDDPAPNACATGRNPEHALVAATTGILDIMNDRELTAVTAHEMGHVKNYDIRVSMIAFGLASVIGIMSDIALRMMWFGGDGDRRDNNNQNPIMLIIGIAVIILAPLTAMMIQLAISRQREYLADATSAMTTRDPEAMISALRKLESSTRPMVRQSPSTSHLFITNPLKSSAISSLFSTHPPLEKRIERLKNNEAKI